MSTKVDHAGLTGLSFLRSTLLVHGLITLRLTIWIMLRVAGHQMTMPATGPSRLWWVPAIISLSLAPLVARV